jgi:hypothetical protein
MPNLPTSTFRRHNYRKAHNAEGKIRAREVAALLVTAGRNAEILTGRADATPKQREETLAEFRPDGTLCSCPLIRAWKTKKESSPTSRR